MATERFVAGVHCDAPDLPSDTQRRLLAALAAPSPSAEFSHEQPAHAMS